MTQGAASGKSPTAGRETNVRESTAHGASGTNATVNAARQRRMTVVA